MISALVNYFFTQSFSFSTYDICIGANLVVVVSDSSRQEEKSLRIKRKHKQHRKSKIKDIIHCSSESNIGEIEEKVLVFDE